MPAPLKAEATKPPVVGAEEEPGTACTVEVDRLTAEAFVILGAMFTNLDVVGVKARGATCGHAVELKVLTGKNTAVL